MYAEAMGTTYGTMSHFQKCTNKNNVEFLLCSSSVCVHGPTQTPLYTVMNELPTSDISNCWLFYKEDVVPCILDTHGKCS